MTESYRIEAPEVPAVSEPTEDLSRYLESPAAMDENAAEITRTYVYFLLPFFSVISLLMVGIVSRGDHCWIVLLPIGFYLVWSSRSFFAPLTIVIVGGCLIGSDVIHYALPLVVLRFVCTCFRNHYVWYCTGAPMPLEVARAVRGTLCASGVPRTVARFDRKQRRDSYVDALRCWFAYNTQNVEAPGMLSTPAGSISQRVSLTCCAILALSVLAVRPFVDSRPSPGRVLGRAASAHFSDDTYQSQAELTTNVAAVVVTMFVFPPIMLLSAFKRCYWQVLCAAYVAREKALTAPPEERYRAILDRLDHAFAEDDS